MLSKINIMGDGSDHRERYGADATVLHAILPEMRALTYKDWYERFGWVLCEGGAVTP